MHNVRMRLPVRLLALPAALTLVLTGCSGGEGETPSGGETSPAAGETTDLLHLRDVRCDALLDQACLWWRLALNHLPDFR